MRDLVRKAAANESDIGRRVQCSPPEVSCSSGFLTPTRQKCEEEKKLHDCFTVGVPLSVFGTEAESRRHITFSYIVAKPRHLYHGVMRRVDGARRKRANTWKLETHDRRSGPFEGFQSSRAPEALKKEAVKLVRQSKENKLESGVQGKSADQTYNKLSTVCALVSALPRPKELSRPMRIFIEDDLLPSGKMRTFGRRRRKSAIWSKDNEIRPRRKRGSK